MVADNAAAPDAAPSAEPPRDGGGPADLDAEIAVVAAILSDPAAFDDVADRLSPDDFATPALAAVYQAIVSCDSSGRPIDVVTVGDELERTGTLAAAGGRAGLRRLLDRAGEVGHLSAHVDIVADRALGRRVLSAGRAIVSTAADPTVDGERKLEHAERAVFDLGDRGGASTMMRMPQAVAQMNEEIARARSSLLIGHPTGFPGLDQLTSGLQPGQLVVLGARPGMGKSALALQMARTIAERTGAAVPFLSYEMTVTELGVRLLSTATGIDSQRLRRGDVPDGADRDIAVAAQKMAELTLLIDDRPPPTIGGVRSMLRRLARRSEVAAVVVDYLQLMEGEQRGRDDSRAVEIGTISRGLKLLATELGVPIIAASQLNRQLELRSNRRPQLADLRESGCLTGDTLLRRADTGATVSLADLARRGVRDVPVWGLSPSGQLAPARLVRAFPTGVKPVWRLRLDDGRELSATASHRFRRPDGWERLERLAVGDLLAVADGDPPAVADAAARTLDPLGRAGASTPTRPPAWARVAEISPLGTAEVYDATVVGAHSYLASGVVAHNSLEQDANLVLFLYRDAVYEPTPSPRDDAELIVAKNRSGPSGMVPLVFEQHCARFTDATARHKAGGAPTDGAFADAAPWEGETPL